MLITKKNLRMLTNKSMKMARENRLRRKELFYQSHQKEIDNIIEMANCRCIEAARAGHFSLDTCIFEVKQFEDDEREFLEEAIVKYFNKQFSSKCVLASTEKETGLWMTIQW